MTRSSPPDEATVLTYDLSPSEPPSQGIVRAVAAATGAEPVGTAAADPASTVLEPLYDYIDPDALDALVRVDPTGHSRGRVQASFIYHGHEVTVDGRGRVTVSPLDDPADFVPGEATGGRE